MKELPQLWELILIRPVNTVSIGPQEIQQPSERCFLSKRKLRLSDCAFGTWARLSKENTETTLLCYGSS